MDVYSSPHRVSSVAEHSWRKHSNGMASIAIVLMLLIPVFRGGFEPSLVQVGSKILGICMAISIYKFPRKTGLWIAGAIVVGLVGNHFSVLEMVRTYREKTGTTVQWKYWLEYGLGCLVPILAVVFSVLSRWRNQYARTAKVEQVVPPKSDRAGG